MLCFDIHITDSPSMKVQLLSFHIHKTFYYVNDIYRIILLIFEKNAPGDTIKINQIKNEWEGRGVKNPSFPPGNISQYQHPL